jgi:protein-tyrosine phosphatase
VTTSTNTLSGAWNFRDIADETGIRPGRFYRSSELTQLDDAGGAAMLRLGITDVADLRSPREVERHGAGRVPAGVTVHLLPFHGPLAEAVEGEDGGEAPHEQSFQRIMTEKPDDEDVSVAAMRYMTEEYERFPTLPGAHIAVRQVVSMLADERPVITHCFAGKDRTGLTVALVLESIGIGRDAILADFLRSNDAVPQLRQSILETIRARAGEGVTDDVFDFAEARLTNEVLGVREEYLDASRRVIDNEYGSLTNYLAALGVTPQQLDRLRSVLLG